MIIFLIIIITIIIIIITRTALKGELPPHPAFKGTTGLVFEHPPPPPD